MDDLLSEFLTETTESLDQLDVELVKLEQDPNDPDLISNIFRLVHTIKGTCGFLGLPRLEAVAHSGENVLGKFRDRTLMVTPEAVSLILEALDRIKELLGELSRTEAEPDGDDKDLISRLDRFAEGDQAPTTEAAPTAAEPQTSAAEPAAGIGLEEPDEFGFVPVPAAMTGQDMDSLMAQQKEAEVESESATAETPSESAEPTAQSSNLPAPKKPDTPPAVRDKDAASAPVANQSIRVTVDLLEDLMTTVSELVLTRNQLLQMLRTLEDSEFTAPLQRLSHITTELQEYVMKTRMQPIGNAWAKLPRIVRDLAHELDKKIDLKMIGAETELDRQVLELIRDPLTHMVRNSGDHGIEGPEERREAGKAETGTITLNAFHEGGHIIIEIADDGRGINIEKVKNKAVQNGLATESELEAMSDEQIQQFVFKAGFSTAQKVTNVSGRGVGMDVVRTNIEKIGGTVEMKSTWGQGSKFVIKIPLTLAIVSALIVEAGGERFCIPQINVVELVRASQTSEHRIETIKSTPVLRLRDRLLPLVSLSDALALKSEDQEESSGERFIVVVQVGAQTFGVIVDRVFDTEEIVVKPVAPILRDINIFSGNTILGDGNVVMILDPNGLSAVSGSSVSADQVEETDEPGGSAAAAELISILLFKAGGQNEPKAVPLSLVARLEEVNLGDIEYSGGMPIVQYRGELMPLGTIDQSADLGDSDKRPVLVFAEGHRKMGLVVDEILDIVEARLDVELNSSRQGLIGSALIAGNATDVIDVGYYVADVCPDWFNQGQGERVEDAAERRVLVVDQSPFFRSMLVPLLEAEGYTVVAVESANDALMLREEGMTFHLILTDVELRGMDGFEFADACRKDPRWSDTPMVALTARTAPQDVNRGRAAGYADYVAKFDRDALMHSLDQTLSMLGEAA